MASAIRNVSRSICYEASKLPSCSGDMETLPNKRRRRSDSPAAAEPRWLIINSCISDKGIDASIADAKTTAATCTSSGKLFGISLGIAAPPASCSLHFDWLGGSGQRHGEHSDESSSEHPKHIRVIAGHDDALLIKWLRPTSTFDDFFLYEAGGGAARPPSLSLLPCFNIPVQMGYRNHRERTPRFRHLTMENTGILRRGGEDGDGDLVVCQLEKTCDPPIYDTGELCVLRVGRDREWTNRRLPIVVHREGSSKLQPWRFSWKEHFVSHAAVPVGNRFLCWVDYGTCFILCDMAEEENPKLRYVPLPAKEHDAGYCGPYPVRGSCTLGAAGPDAVRFVRVSPARCVCGDPAAGTTRCGRSGSSFNVTTWTMTLSAEEPTTWVKDVVLDCEEIWKWRLPSYGCLPRDKHLEYPMVSSDDPDVICFKVEDMAAEINTRSKKLLSVVPSNTRDLEEDKYPPPHFLTVKLEFVGNHHH